MLRSIDQSVDPCDDFYAFSCNKWIKNNPIPDGKSMWGTFGKLEQSNQLVVKNVLGKLWRARALSFYLYKKKQKKLGLTERPVATLKSNAEKKAKLYYQSCLDEDDIMEKLGAEPMNQLLVQIGGWNASASGFNVTGWSLERTVRLLQNKYNMGGLFSWAVGEDDRNSSRHIIQIDQGGLTLPTRENYLNRSAHAKVLTAYLDYMTKVAVLLGANESDAKPQMADVIALETRLAEITSKCVCVCVRST